MVAADKTFHGGAGSIGGSGGTDGAGRGVFWVNGEAVVQERVLTRLNQADILANAQEWQRKIAAA